MFDVLRPSSSLGRADDSPKFSRIVDEGLLIALSAIRMAVKNHLIVGALRDLRDYDPVEYGEIVRAQLTLQIEQNRAAAKRVSAEKRRLGAALWLSELTPDERLDLKLLARRRRMYRGLASALRAVAADARQVQQLVETARIDAGSEIGDALQLRLIDRVIDPRAPDYEFERPHRMRSLGDELAALLAAHEASSSDRARA